MQALAAQFEKKYAEPDRKKKPAGKRRRGQGSIQIIIIQYYSLVKNRKR
jgi:hypothetical protein